MRAQAAGRRVNPARTALHAAGLITASRLPYAQGRPLRIGNVGTDSSSSGGGKEVKAAAASDGDVHEVKAASGSVHVESKSSHDGSTDSSGGSSGGVLCCIDTGFFVDHRRCGR